MFLVTDLCSVIMPFVLLSDIFDLITLSQCEIVFYLVEEKLPVWKSVSLPNHLIQFDTSNGLLYHTAFSLLSFSWYDNYMYYDNIILSCKIVDSDWLREI